MNDLPLGRRAALALQRGIAYGIFSRPLLCELVGRKRLAPRGGRRLDAQCAALLALHEVDAAADLTQFPPAEARERFALSMGLVEEPGPPGVVTEDHRVAGPGGAIPLRLYIPPGAVAPSPAIVFFHGGGWVVGSIATHDALCRRFAVGARCRVVSVEYRVGPEHRAPAAPDDALAAFRWVAAHAGDLGIDEARIAVAGDSAGGNLAAVVARAARDDARRPALQVLIYPGLDATRSQPSHAELGQGYLLTAPLMTWFLEHYVAPGDYRRPDVSPLLAEAWSGLPPALVYTAGFDPLRDEGKLYAERLEAAGVRTRHWEFPSLIHGFVQMTGAVDAARHALDEIVSDVGRALSRGW
ncbi:lipase-esterase (lipN) [Minicystis rosea]|nr:lipase-esterase (lipN) [Minicystis rosea]